MVQYPHTVIPTTHPGTRGVSSLFGFPMENKSKTHAGFLSTIDNALLLTAKKGTSRLSTMLACFLWIILDEVVQ